MALGVLGAGRTGFRSEARTEEHMFYLGPST